MSLGELDISIEHLLDKSPLAVSLQGVTMEKEMN